MCIERICISYRQTENVALQYAIYEVEASFCIFLCCFSSQTPRTFRLKRSPTRERTLGRDICAEHYTPKKEYGF